MRTPVEIRNDLNAIVADFSATAHMPDVHRGHAQTIVRTLMMYPWACDQVPVEVLRTVYAEGV